MPRLSCRFYKSTVPENDSVVTVVVQRITDVAAYVRLLEYDNLEGMILMSELSRRRIRSINKLIKVGRNESVLVIRIDPDKNYIDLSKRRVTPEDVDCCSDKYNRAKIAYYIVIYSAEVMGLKTKEELEHLMEQTAWKFHEKFSNCGGAYEAFRRLLTDPSLLDDSDLTEEQKNILVHNIRHRLEPKRAKVRSDIEIACYTPEGIQAVKSSLLCGIELSKSTQTPVKINLIAPPIYMISTMVVDRIEGLDVMNKVVDKIKEEILSKNGYFNLKLAPKIVSDIEEAQRIKQLEEIEKANELIDGDDESSESGVNTDVDDQILSGGSVYASTA
ncbi:hypothetical protein MXB_46 [Myxobolus squamalis]|nr:hypothetical protein MXB_46 [Myxobolus squamalis]